jgi:hypothetical protein
MVELPTEVFVAAPKSIEVFAPVATENGLGGLVVTPVGRFAKVIWTELAKPFLALTEIVTG